ncbi:MAG: hypothetical protein ACR2G3_12665 [Solirubrobacterales bacterium]
MNPPVPEIRFNDEAILRAFEASRLWRALLAPDWTHPTLKALMRGDPVEVTEAHMLFDIDMRDALDRAWEAPPDEPKMHAPEYDYLDPAIGRIQTAHPGVVDELLGDALVDEEPG